MSALVYVVFAMGLAWVLAAPHFSPRARIAGSAELSGNIAELRDKRRELLISLRDLELDYHAGKLGEEAYRQGRREILDELAPILDLLDATHEHP